MISFQPVQYSDEFLFKYVELFNASFPNVEKFNFEYIAWLYRSNPDGFVVGYDAIFDNKVIAHYACIPSLMNNNGEIVQSLLSLNTATHPDFQGKGLFTKLANLTYELAAQSGYDCVYGIANANSTPGFIKKLGFQFVRPLYASIGLGTFFKETNSISNLSSFNKVWNVKSLEWRAASPANQIYLNKNNNQELFTATMFGFYCPVSTNLKITQEIKIPTKNIISPFKLFIGLTPDNMRVNYSHLNIPKFLRPSPLNLIYKSLNARVNTLDGSKVFLSFLDFDGY